MRTRQKTCEKVVYNFPYKILNSLKDKAEGSSCINLFQTLNSAEDGVLQINTLQEIKKILTLKSPEELSACRPDIVILCYMFYQSPLKSSQKKTLNRILQDISCQNNELVTASLQSSLENILNILLKDRSVVEIEKCTDCLLGLLDNFPIGITVVRSTIKIVWEYFSSTLTYILEELRKSQCTELYSTCQSILKAFTLTLQNNDDMTSITESLGDDSCLYSDEILNCIKSLLASESTLLNCRLNAGIALCYYYNFLGIDKFKEETWNFFGGEVLVSSDLCILSGIMAVIPCHEFVSTQTGKSVADTVLHRILHTSECVGDSDLLLLCARDLIQWSNIMCTVLCGKSKQPLDESQLEDVKKMFRYDGNEIALLFKYVLQNREHYVETLRHLTKDLFKNILNLHILSTELDPSSPQNPLLKQMTCYLLEDLPPYSSGKYRLLSCIVEIVETDCILQWYPSLPDTLYNALKDVNVITHVADLLESLYRKSFLSDNCEKFKDDWLKPLLVHLCSNSKEQAIAMNEHVLPKLFKVKPVILPYLLSKLSAKWEQNQGNCFSALIVCVKFHLRRDPDKSALDFISFNSLVNAMCHADDQVRLSAFAVICENTKTTEPVPVETFDLIKITLQHNMNCQAPAFRQQLVSCLKKLFNRMDKSKQSLEKRKQTDDLEISLYTMQQKFERRPSVGMETYFGADYIVHQRSYQELYEDFLTWIKYFLYQSLCPGANFPRRVTALNLLSYLHSIFSEYFSVVSEPTEIHTLLYALQDTYENNKISALKVLAATESSFMESQLGPCSETLLETTLTLASSTKPPDTLTAAYLFALMAQFEFFNPVFQNRIAKQVEKGYCPRTVADHPSSTTERVSSCFSAVLMLTGELLEHLEEAQESLLDAAAHAPLYGVLACIKSVVSLVDFRLLKNSESSLLWSCLIQELITLSIKVATTVEPVVCNSSPEGHLPMDTDSDNIQLLQTAVQRAIGTRFQSAIVESEDSFHEESLKEDKLVLNLVKTHAVTAQILLLCCWRTHKEVSLLFGEIAEKIPVCNVENNKENGLLNVSQVVDMGQYFIRQMSLVKHKGAFEQAFIGFSKLCHMLWRSDITILKELPKEWLNDLLLAVRGLKDNTQLCSTRRSAGLPFIVQALLTSDPCLSTSSFFKSSISSLLSMASLTNNNKYQEEKIHALNILRALFRDACLSDVLVPFVSEGLVVSITGFKSKSWAVRNSSTLLFSALMTRIFGVNHSQDETGRKNRLTGRTFFSYYKETYSFLFEELKHCVSVLSGGQSSVSLVPALYPILLILGRLYPAPGERDQRLASFIPYLQMCGNSSVWKVRALAAKVLVSLVPTEMVEDMLRSLFFLLNPPDKDLQFKNKVHGKCLQILSLLKEVPNMTQDKKDIERSLSIWIHSASRLVSSFNMCYTTRVAYLEIALCSMTINTALDPDLTGQLISDILSEIKPSALFMPRPDKEQFLCTAFVVSMLSLMQMGPKQMLKLLPNIDKKYKCLTSLFEEFLDTPYESLHCTVLYFLVCLFGGNRDLDETNLECSMYPVFFPNIFNARVCASIQACKVDRDKLKHDKKLTTLVISMLAKKENNSSCLGIVYQLLSLMPLAVESSWVFLEAEKNLCHCQKLEFVLRQLNDCNRDDIFNQLMLFATQVSLKICECLQTRKISMWRWDVPEHKDCYDALNLWSQKITECTHPESCISRRKMAISAFRSIFHPSMVEKLKLLGDSSAKLWQSLVYLLIDDEPEIKQQSTEIVISLWAAKMLGDNSLPVVPLLALDHLAQLFIQEQTCSTPTYIGVFLNWMLSCQSLKPGSTGDEQPFDPGELNVFEEHFIVANHMMVHLSRVVSQNSEQTLLVDISRISCWNHLGISNDSPFDINKVINLCLTESETLVEGLISHCADSPFFDARFDYDVIQLVQRCLVVMALSTCATIKFKCRGLELLSKMKKVRCRTYFLNCILDDFNQLLVRLD